jgi:hypothetical protein
MNRFGIFSYNIALKGAFLVIPTISLRFLGMRRYSQRQHLPIATVIASKVLVSRLREDSIISARSGSSPRGLTESWKGGKQELKINL